MQNHMNDPISLFPSTTPRIIIAPAYRLNLLGFLAAPTEQETGNFGFWDQRLALEWTYQHIHLFHGNPHNIAVGGLSAGAYSSFFQLYYDTYLPSTKRIIKRAFLWSNAVGVQPNQSISITNLRQFDELISYFSIPSNLTISQKLSALRSIPASDLVAAIPNLKLHTFRAITDNSFILPTFLSSIHSGAFAARLKANGTSLLLGEVSHEGLLYRLINPPSSYSTLITQLENYYPPPVVSALLHKYRLPSPSAPAVEWQDLFGKICGDCQVHSTIRGLAHCLLSPPDKADAMPMEKVHRYRIKWRAPSLGKWLKPEVGVCHAADSPIWWASGWRAGFNGEDKENTMRFLEPFGRFLSGERVEWGTKSEREIREMGVDGTTRVVEDESWDRGLEVWKTMWEAQRETKAKI
jgi:carboxylesterase type B